MLQALKCSGKFCITNEIEETGIFEGEGEEQEAYAKFGRWDSKRKGRKLPGDRNGQQNSLQEGTKENMKCTIKCCSIYIDFEL